MEKTKAIGLLSGGLDSTLACAIMQKAGIEVVGLHCSTGFCLIDYRRKIQRKQDQEKDLRNAALVSAAQIKIQIEIVDISKEYLDIVFKPKHGYGSSLNPCIDCRILMLKTAKNYAEQCQAKFVFTGEVLGQRPMSQHLRTMKMIEKECGLAGYLLRPLSAKLLDITVPEQSGWVNREHLYAIEGRSRKAQIKLAEEFNITDFPAPAGGCCVLVDKNYAKKFKDLAAYSSRETITWEQLTLLKVGRHLRIHPQLKVIVGREEAENNFLNRYASTNHLFKPARYPGATVLADGLIDENNEKVIASISAYYSDARLHQSVEIVHTFDNTMKLLTVPPASAQEILKIRI